MALSSCAICGSLFTEELDLGRAIGMLMSSRWLWATAVVYVIAASCLAWLVPLVPKAALAFGKDADIKACSRDNRVVAVCDKKNELKFWNIPSGRCIARRSYPNAPGEE